MSRGWTGKLSFFNYNPLDFSDELSDTYRAINHAFKASAEVRRGELRDFSTSSAVCFVRAIPGHNMLVVANTTKDSQTVRVPISLAGAAMTDLLNGTTQTMPVTLELPAYGYAIYMN